MQRIKNGKIADRITNLAARAKQKGQSLKLCPSTICNKPN
jgi:hypothetical protein